MFIIGIDEVGRGPLAGPVTVSAIMISLNLSRNLKKMDPKSIGALPLRDSKKLSSKQREQWAKWIKDQKIPYVISSLSPKVIDKINISRAANLAASKAVRKLVEISAFRSANYKIFLDGGLYINPLPKLKFKNMEIATVIKGDEKIPAVSLASIIAKVHRDKYMQKMHRLYPSYGFDKHKGYGTKLHCRIIKKMGPCEIHRRSFIKKINAPVL